MFQLERQTEKQAARPSIFRQSENESAEQAAGFGNAGLSSYLSYQVSSPDDPEEVEADRMADVVTSGGTIHRSSDESDGGTASVSSGSLSSGGEAMDDGLRGSMESAFDTDFSGVRIHRDQSAARMSEDLSARAFTAGQDIYFSEGSYDPGSQEGEHLIAHELAHVEQGKDGIFRDPNPPTAEQISEKKEWGSEWISSAGKCIDSADRYKQASALTEQEYSAWKENYNDLVGADKYTIPKETLEYYHSQLVEGSDKTELKTLIDAIVQLKSSLDTTNSDIETLKNDNVALPEEVKAAIMNPRFKKFCEAVGVIQGIAISSEDIGKIFEGVKPASKYEKGGTGAGANMVNAVLEGHDTTEARHSRNDKLEALGLADKISGTNHTANTRAASSNIRALGGVVGGVGDALSSGSFGMKDAGKDTVTVDGLDKAGNAVKATVNTTDNVATDESALKGRMKTGSKHGGAVKNGLSAFADIMDIGANSAEVSKQRQQDANAKNQIQKLSQRLCATIPTGSATSQCNLEVKQLSEYIKSGKGLSVKNEKKDLSTQIRVILKKYDGDLQPDQKSLLNSILLLQVARQSSRQKAKDMGWQVTSSVFKTILDMTSLAGSITSLMGNSLASGLISLAGSLFGMFSGAIDATAARMKASGAADTKKQQGSPLQVQIINAMKGLPSLPETMIKSDNLVKKEHIIVFEQYTSCFHAVDAANIDMVDLLYAAQQNKAGTKNEYEQNLSDEERMKNILSGIA